MKVVEDLEERGQMSSCIDRTGCQCQQNGKVAKEGLVLQSRVAWMCLGVCVELSWYVGY